ncbi:short-chain dehydrogenase [Fusarium phyllophilum]|uniref:Short-chain dehydrogenase n=1 Tax=Fusarium phyllophilum TaxID=47803 RepID=A0A8H5IZE8_9HYPO|nr:short-chain dehydrogenase [Fusarium phyllophilum]
MASHREGFTIDSIARLLNKTVFNPFLTIPIAAALTRTPPSVAGHLPHYITQNNAWLRLIITTLACTGCLSTLNDFLTDGYANNWTTDRGWNWDRELVLVTGGSGGIGGSLAQQLLAKNPKTRIIIVDFAPMTWKAPQGTQVFYYQADLSDSTAIKKLCQRIKDEVGHPTVLVNNAGLIRGKSIIEAEYSDIEITTKTNLTAPLLLLKEFLPDMVRNNHGHVVHLGSISAFIPPAKAADYAATKSGIVAVHEALQLELKYTYKAPKIRTSLVILLFARTPLMLGDTKQSKFIYPVLESDTVAEAIKDTLHSGRGKTMYLPGVVRPLTAMVSSMIAIPKVSC